jgi:hypothetical protein
MLNVLLADDQAVILYVLLVSMIAISISLIYRGQFILIVLTDSSLSLLNFSIRFDRGFALIQSYNHSLRMNDGRRAYASTYIDLLFG